MFEMVTLLARICLAILKIDREADKVNHWIRHWWKKYFWSRLPKKIRSVLTLVWYLELVLLMFGVIAADLNPEIHPKFISGRPMESLMWLAVFNMVVIAILLTIAELFIVVTNIIKLLNKVQKRMAEIKAN